MQVSQEALTSHYQLFTELRAEHELPITDALLCAAGSLAYTIADTSHEPLESDSFHELETMAFALLLSFAKESIRNTKTAISSKPELPKEFLQSELRLYVNLEEFKYLTQFRPDILQAYSAKKIPLRTVLKTLEQDKELRYPYRGETSGLYPAQL